MLSARAASRSRATSAAARFGVEGLRSSVNIFFETRVLRIMLIMYVKAWLFLHVGDAVLKRPTLTRFVGP